jgi:hypothetical protein
MLRGGDWAAGDPRPRPGGSLDVLIDGSEALPRMVAELERAEFARPYRRLVLLS